MEGRDDSQHHTPCVVSDVPARSVGRGPRCHSYAVDDGTHTDTQGTPSAVVCHVGEVGVGVKGDCLDNRYVTISRPHPSALEATPT